MVCSSTNDILTSKVENYQDLSALAGHYVTASKQTEGQGQGSNQWYSSEGKNLLVSFLVLPEKIHPEEQFSVSRLTALGLFDLIRSILPITTDVKIKWPNDMYADGKKIAGILIRNRIAGTILSSSVIGCGINVNEQSFPENIPEAVSIRQIIGRNIPVDEVLEKMIQAINKINISPESTSQLFLHRKYDALLFGLDEERLFEDKNGIFKGVIQGTTTSGLLKISAQDRMRKYTFGEVRYR